MPIDDGPLEARAEASHRLMTAELLDIAREHGLPVIRYEQLTRDCYDDVAASLNCGWIPSVNWQNVSEEIIETRRSKHE